MSKPCLVFSTLWFAEKCLKDRQFCVAVDDEKYLHIDLHDEDYELYSIALYPPKDIQLCHEAGLKTPPTEFVPTSAMLHSYKQTRDWDAYLKQFIARLKGGKESVKRFVESLQEDTVYFMCCWENTSKGAKCHRRIVYDALKHSQLGKNLSLIYVDQ